MQLRIQRSEPNQVAFSVAVLVIEVDRHTGAVDQLGQGVGDRSHQAETSAFHACFAQQLIEKVNEAQCSRQDKADHRERQGEHDQGDNGCRDGAGQGGVEGCGTYFDAARQRLIHEHTNGNPGRDDQANDISHLGHANDLGTGARHFPHGGSSGEVGRSPDFIVIVPCSHYRRHNSAESPYHAKENSSRQLQRVVVRCVPDGKQRDACEA